MKLEAKLSEEIEAVENLCMTLEESTHLSWRREASNEEKLYSFIQWRAEIYREEAPILKWREKRLTSKKWL